MTKNNINSIDFNIKHTQVKNINEFMAMSVQQSSEGMAYTDLDGTLIYINKAWCEMHGYISDKELLGKNLKIFHSKKQMENEVIPFNDIVMKRGTNSGEMGHITKDGKLISTLMAVNLLKDAKGNAIAMAAVAKDITAQKKSDEKLIESEKKYRFLFSNMTNGFALHKIVLNEKIVPINYTFIEINEAFENQTGLKRRNVIGKSVTKVLPGIEKDKTDWIGIYGKVALTQKSIYFENFAEPLNKWYSVNAYSPQKGYFATIFEDITDRKKAEEELKKLTATNKMILDTIGEGIYGLDREGNTTFVNPAAAKMIGWDVKDIIGKGQHDLLHHTKADGSHYDKKECPIYAAYKDGNVHRVDDEVFWCKDGSSFPVEYISTPIRDNNGVLTGAVVTFMDITERKLAKDKLLASMEDNQRFRNALDKVPAFVYLKDTQSRYLYANQSTLELFGVSAKGLIGCKDSKFFPPKTVKHLNQIDSRVFLGEHTDEEIESKDEHGKRQVFLEVKTPLYSETKKEIVGLLGISTDITERIRAEEKLKSRNKELEIFYEAAVNRELNMIELKKEINELLESKGEKPKYKIIR